MRGLRAILTAASFVAFVSLATTEAPLPTAAPKKSRVMIVESALSFVGSPYLYGGTDASGFDCSGLVYRVYLQSLGAVLPRTAREQFAFREAIELAEAQPGDLLFFDTTGPIAHVGIYLGEDRFIHAASEGPRRGVIESSLSEGYWSAAFSGAGRILPPAEYLGLLFSASLGASLGAQDVVRGVRSSVGVAYRLRGLEAGLELRPEYDATLGVVRVPLVLALGIDKHLKVYAGPAATIGRPMLGGTRPYDASGGLLATAGIEFTPFRLRLAGAEAGLTGELVYNRYVAGGTAGAEASKDLAARVRAGIGLSLRWGI